MDDFDIEKLPEVGADPNVQDSKYGHSPMHVAAIKLGGKYRTADGIDGTEAIKQEGDIQAFIGSWAKWT